MKKIRAVLMIACAVILYSPLLKSQDGIAFDPEKNIPPSPTVAALARYVETPTSLYTGQPNISIPLYNIKLKNLSLPISLSYNASGHKVADAASWVGLGWSLNAGGVITRAVKGGPDDLCGYTSAGVPLGYLYNNGVDFQNLPSNDADLLEKGLDTEPDIFYANFAGHSVKFFFQKDGWGEGEHYIHTIPLKPWLIEYEEGASCSSHLNDPATKIRSFTITTEDGVKYTFADYEYLESEGWSTDKAATEADPFPGGQTAAGAVSEYISAWHLSSITTPLGETVNFAYRQETVNERTRQNDSWYYTADDGTFYGHESSSHGFSTHLTQKLSMIEWSGNKIQFNRGPARDDLFSGYAVSNALGGIEVRNYLGEPIKKFDFSYSYFEAANAPEHFPYLKYRLKLESVTESNKNKSLPPYEFEYYYEDDVDKTKQLPHRGSVQQDFWGYYNRTGSTSLKPKLYFYRENFDPVLNTYTYIYPLSTPNGEENIIAGADRTPKLEATKACVLKKITYPTGGYAEYEYELNEFLNPDHRAEYDFHGHFLREIEYPSRMFDIGNDGIIDYAIKCGGLRLKKQILSPDGVDLQETEYSYMQDGPQGTVTSGRLIHLPQLGYQTFPYLDHHGYPEKVLQINSSSVNGFGSGNHIGYTEVTAIKNGNGYTTSKYTLPGAFNIGRTHLVEDGYYEGSYLFNKDYQVNFVEYKYASSSYLAPQAFYYAQGPTMPAPLFDWARGNITEQTVFAESGRKVSKKAYTYETVVGEFVDATKYMTCYPLTLDGSIPVGYSFLYYDFQYATGRMDLKTEINTVYDSEDDTKSQETATSYTYDGYSKNLNSVSTSYSDGSVSGKEIKYSEDFSGNDVFADMKHTYNWQINKPVEVTTYENGKVTGSSVTEYDCWGCTTAPDLPSVQTGKFLPKQIHMLETDLPLTDFSPATSGLTIDSRCKPKVVIDAYDTYGNLEQYHQLSAGSLAEGTENSLVWGYKGMYPVAEVKNAKRNEVYHNNFEEKTDLKYERYSGTTSLLQGAAKTGNSKLRLEKPSAGETYTYFSYIYPNAPAGTTFRYSCWFYSTGPRAQLFIHAPGSGITYNDHACLTSTVTGKWTYLEGTVTIPAGRTASAIRLRVDNDGGGTVYFDDLRLYPADGSMTTRTYDPLIGVTSVTDDSGVSAHYTYDELGRLQTVTNDDGNVIEQYDYKYANE